MTDDFSIENIKNDQDAFLNGLFIHEQDGYYFHENVLKRLREELLGDFAYWLVLDRQGRAYDDDFIEAVNKRFGVKE